MLRQAISDTAIYTAAGVLSRGIGLLLLPIYTRSLSASEYGTLDLIILFSSILTIVLTLEISQGCARFFPDASDEASKNNFFSSSFYFTALLYSFALILALVNAETIAPLILDGHVDIKLYVLMVLYFWLNGISLHLQGHLRWEFKQVEFGISSIIVGVVTAAIIVTAYLGDRLSLSLVLLALIAGQLANFVYCLPLLTHRFTFHIDQKILLKMLAFSAPLVVSSLAFWLNNYIDRLMVLHYLGLENVGVYAVAFRISSVIIIGFVGLQHALLPLIYSHYKQAETPQKIAEIFRFFAAFVIMLFLGIYLFNHELVMLLAGSSFNQASPILPLLIVSIIFAQSYLFAPGVFLGKKTILASFLNASACLINIVGNILLIPHFGLAGAAIATLAGSVSLFALYLLIGQKYYPITYPWRSLLKVIIVVLIAVFIGSLYEPLNWLAFLYNIIMLLVVFASIFFFKLVQLDQLLTIIGSLKGLIKSQKK